MTRPALTLLSLFLILAPTAAQAETFAQRWARKVRGFEQENATLAPERDVVLFGSSSTEGWAHGGRVGRYLPTIGSRTVNRGISGDGIGISNTTGLANRLQTSVLDAQPRFVFLLNGRNSLGYGVAKTAEAYERVVRRIRAGLPEATVVIVSCAPVRGRYARLKTKVKAFNARLVEIAAQTGCPYIDTHSQFVGADGLLKRSFTRDGLHFNNKGYTILGREMEAVVARIEAEQAAAARRAAQAQQSAEDDLQTFLSEADALLDGTCLEPALAEALRREVFSRRSNPQRCFEHPTVEAFLAAQRARPSSKGLRGLGGLGGE